MTSYVLAVRIVTIGLMLSVLGCDLKSDPAVPTLEVTTKQKIDELTRLAWKNGYAVGQKDGACMTLHQVAIELKRPHADRPELPCTAEEWNHPWGVAREKP